MSRVYYAFALHENGITLDPLSFGAVSDDGHELYIVNGGMDDARAARDPWLRQHVWPHLPTRPCPGGHRCMANGAGHLDRDHPDVLTSEQFRGEIENFLADVGPTELWADTAPYEHVALGQCWGPRGALPSWMPRFTHDVQQERARLGGPTLPDLPAGAEHHALADARLTQARVRFMEQIYR